MSKHAKDETPPLEQFRIEYVYPYLESIGETGWTPWFPTYDQAHAYMDRWDITAGYGRVLTVEKFIVMDWDLVRTDKR